jgi:integrase
MARKTEWVHERRWKTRKGEERSAWVVRYPYIDPKTGQKSLHIQTFPTKTEATEYAKTNYSDIRSGRVIPDVKTCTVEYVGREWLRAKEMAQLERSTLAQYEQMLELHIIPFIGPKLVTEVNDINVLRQFEGDLFRAGRSPAMIRKVLTGLSGILGKAKELKFIPDNQAYGLQPTSPKHRHKKRRLELGIDVPLPSEVALFLKASLAMPLRWYALLLLDTTTGLRASEVRGLIWPNIDLNQGVLHVRQRADRYGKIGPPKSDAGHRSVSIGPELIRILRLWQMECPRRMRFDDKGRPLLDAEGKPVMELHYVFPTLDGNILNYHRIINKALRPAMRAAGLTTPVLRDGQPIVDASGRPVVRLKYPGMHCLRHYYASVRLNQLGKAGAGREYAFKRLQTEMGHAHFKMTMDTYAHVFPEQRDDAAIAADEAALLGIVPKVG